MSSRKARGKDLVILALGDCPENWDGYLLRTYGLPQEPQSRSEISESAFVDENGSRTPLEDVAGHQIRIGEEPPSGLLKVWAEHSGLENEPSEDWKRSQAFLRVFTLIYACQMKLPKNERLEMLKKVDELRPNVSPGEFPKELGTPEELYRRWRGWEIDVKFVHKNRSNQIIEITQYPMPPDEDEDLDESGEPRGHWDGLTFIPE